MGKIKPRVPSIYELGNYLTEDNLLPIFFFCGEDTFTIDNSVREVTKAAESFLSSDFDKEIISADRNQTLNQIIDIASAFPFGEGKKLIVLKNFERLPDRKLLAEYAANPAEFTVLVISQYGKVSNYSTEPYGTLLSKNYLFEARDLKGQELVNWLVRQAATNKLKLSDENAKAVIDIVGEDKSLLDMQLTKFIDYLNEDDEVEIQIIKQLSSNTKEYNIFNLQDALGRGDKASCMKVVLNLLDNGIQMTFIISMLSRFIATIAQSIELRKKNVPSKSAAKSLNISEYYYNNCLHAKFFMADKKILNAVRALHKADLTIKTTSSDEKSVIMILLSEMLV